MLTLIRTEFLKLRTIRSPWLLLAVGVPLVVAGVSGMVISKGGVPTRAMQSNAVAHVGLASILTLVFGILAVAGEYRHKTITDTYMSTPGRTEPLVAKLVVYTLIGAISAAIWSVAGLLAEIGWWAGKGASFSWSDSGMWTTIGGAIGWNAAFAAIGVGLGALVRNLVGAVALALAWIALIEGILSQLLGSLGRWLPFNAGRALGVSAADTSSDLLSRWAGGVVLVLYALAFTIAAVTTTVRRDVG